ncbi:ABC transporter permease [Paralimibaculum aggregatum]|uniref:Transport permease protein n=1 Tax=Paralimibaculum aggregatum TaxID=3036245 RepID=A0ABQ6LMR7_9RHOB|nr:ABC transporter permease [Limibaculum sp. NKW23]GMG81741.1 ABC transporter permease [Limibaculum sp. NKW23]
MADLRGMGVRRFGRVNWLGLQTLATREIRRFLAVYTQTIMAPVATSVLFMVVFTLAFGKGREGISGMPFEQFLAPGVLMMAVIQNAFANTSSSLMIAKVQGNIVDTLMPPLSPGEVLAGYALGGLARGLACALAVGLLVFPVVGIGVAHPLWALAFVVLGSLMLSLLGLLAAIYAEKFDQMAAITNFVVTPLSFLSGTFYSIERLPETFQALSHANPIFYLIDGFRFGVLGVSDSSPWVGLVLALAVVLLLGAIALSWLARGYRLKS